MTTVDDVLGLTYLLRSEIHDFYEDEGHLLGDSDKKNLESLLRDLEEFMPLLIQLKADIEASPPKTFEASEMQSINVSVKRYDLYIMDRTFRGVISRHHLAMRIL